MDLNDRLMAFAGDVGPGGPVWCAGGGTHAPVPTGPREVRAPAGITWLAAEEMTCRCGAGTTVAELRAATAAVGMRVHLPMVSDATTVGGAIAVGHGSITQLLHGPPREALLQATVVTSAGQLATVGGPTVKNVTGYDLCRLLAGSWGTVGPIADVILRMKPVPACERWYATASDRLDPFDAFARLYRPAAVLWDGVNTWIGLEGHPDDVAEQAAAVGLGLGDEVDGPPPIPAGGRVSVAPAAVRAQLEQFPAGDAVAEIGVGVVHQQAAAAPVPLPPGVALLQRRIKEALDPSGRFNPGVEAVAGWAS